MVLVVPFAFRLSSPSEAKSVGPDCETKEFNWKAIQSGNYLSNKFFRLTLRVRSESYETSIL